MNGAYSTPTQYYRGLGTDISLPMVTERHVNDFECMSAVQSDIFSPRSVPCAAAYAVSKLLCALLRNEAFVSEAVLVVVFLLQCHEESIIARHTSLALVSKTRLYRQYRPQQ